VDNAREFSEWVDDEPGLFILRAVGRAAARLVMAPVIAYAAVQLIHLFTPVLIRPCLC